MTVELRKLALECALKTDRGDVLKCAQEFLNFLLGPETPTTTNGEDTEADDSDSGYASYV